MNAFSLEAVTLDCPYCGEPIELLVDCSIPAQQYIEDCSVCCRPMTVHVVIDQDGLPSVQLAHEDEA